MERVISRREMTLFFVTLLLDNEMTFLDSLDPKQFEITFIRSRLGHLNLSHRHRNVQDKKNLGFV